MNNCTHSVNSWEPKGTWEESKNKTFIEFNLFFIYFLLYLVNEFHVNKNCINWSENCVWNLLLAFKKKKHENLFLWNDTNVWFIKFLGRSLQNHLRYHPIHNQISMMADRKYHQQKYFGHGDNYGDDICDRYHMIVERVLHRHHLHEIRIK